MGSGKKNALMLGNEMLATVLTIYFVVCHGGPAADFAEFAQSLEKRGHHVEILATGPAMEKLGALRISAREFNPHQLDLESEESRKLLIAEIVKACSAGNVVMTDIGSAMMGEVHQALDREFP